MITGEVNSDAEAVVSLEVRGKGRRRTTITAVVDTGFDGHLTLPEALISKLSLPWSRFGSAELARPDGRGVRRVRWAHCLGRRVTSDSNRFFSGTPLVGMELMKCHRLTVDIVPGGSLVIEKLQAS